MVSDELTSHSEVHIRQGHLIVYSAVVHGKWLDLPREICVVSRNRD